MTSSRTLLFFKKNFNLTYNKNKLYKPFDCRSRDMHNFDILEKRLKIVSPTHFVYEFLRKILFH